MHTHICGIMHTMNVMNRGGTTRTRSRSTGPRIPPSKHLGAACGTRTMSTSSLACSSRRREFSASSAATRATSGATAAAEGVGAAAGVASGSTGTVDIAGAGGGGPGDKAGVAFPDRRPYRGTGSPGTVGRGLAFMSRTATTNRRGQASDPKAAVGWWVRRKGPSCYP
jgi:hypothetical protein